MKRFAMLVIGSMLGFAWNAFPLSIGDTAPAFSLAMAADSSVSLADCRGRVCVLYFCCFG
jgi:hypothetical protein